MEWEDRQESSNVEDRRGMGGGTKAGIAAGGGGLLVLMIAMLLPPEYRAIFTKIVGGGQQQVQPDDNNQPPGPSDPEEDRRAKFTKVILADTERVWGKLFREELNREYEKPVLVLFKQSVKSGCGVADSGVGPFYCPADDRLYIDLSFFNDMEDKRKLDAPGEFARAFVVAHEVGHHIQKLLRYTAKADKHRGTALENQYSVRLELQADYLAGVWAHHLQKEQRAKKGRDVISQEDIRSGANAAFKIGDDWLQKKARGRVVSTEKFTHGKSEARMYWLLEGIKTGEFSAAKLDTFFNLPYDEVDVGKLQR